LDDHTAHKSDEPAESVVEVFHSTHRFSLSDALWLALSGQNCAGIHPLRYYIHRTLQLSRKKASVTLDPEFCHPEPVKGWQLYAKLSKERENHAIEK
jgi:hypothetical protein